MFGNRRKRGTSNPPPNNSNTNPSAATAAAQAFLKNQVSNASLASAAANAALRSRPTTPMSVADVQTKRTLRRSGSAASMASSVAGSVSGGQRPSLQRRGSSGSMTERTFRDPSPSAAVPSAPDAPPVPALPKDMPAIPKKSHRRASSLEMLRRVASPPPNKKNGRGSSLGPGTTAQSSRKPGSRMTSLSSVQELTDRPDSRGSVNFSYPRGLRPESPMGQRQLTSPSPSRANPPKITSPTNQELVYDPNSRRFIPAAQLYALEQSVLDAANKPVKKKKKVAPQQYTGTHLADGTVGGRPRGTAVDAMEVESQQPAPPPAPIPEPVAPVDPTATPPKRKKKKKVVMASDSETDEGSFVPSSSADESDYQTNGFKTRAGALLAKKPSIVREDREREDEEDDTPKARSSASRLDTETRPISPSPLPRSSTGRGHGRGQAGASAAFAQERQQTRSASQPPVQPVTPTGGLAKKRSVRVQSVSPARTPRFSVTPDSLLVKHQPPARSISPRKSALKLSNSPRGPSPAEDFGADISEASNVAAINTDELSVPTKKAHRVSFDETNVAFGQAATPVTTDSPIAHSPQTKKSWFGTLGRGKKKDSSFEDDDEIMKPRPALPSFGSVRKSSNPHVSAVEERALVRPAEPVESTTSAFPSSPLLTSPTGEVIESQFGQSNNHQVGVVISPDASSRNAANISKSREPLPSQTSSVEGSSETDSSVSDQKSPVGVGQETKSVETVQQAGTGEPEIDPSTIDRDSQTPTPTGRRANGQVPKIAILQATPVLEHKKEWPDMDHMPGGWEGSTASDSGSNVEEGSPVLEQNPTDVATPATVRIAEPSPIEHQPGSPVVGGFAAENAHAIPDIAEETEESETDTSLYSDAAEDLTDGEGDGFQSLNAVIESPAASTFLPGLAISTPPESPTVRTAKEKAYKSSQLSRKSSEPELDEGWNKAQEYWKGLTAEKRRQLEQEARAEAEAAGDSDSTIEAKPAPKPKKTVKKTVNKAAVQPATTEVPVLRQPTANGERSYMIKAGSKSVHDGDVPAMRSSMRAQPANTSQDTQFRQSMRETASMRSSLRGEHKPQPKASVSRQNRPVSLPAVPAPPATKHARNLSAASAAAASGAAKKDMAPKPPMLRRQSSADSDSSFKRARKSTDGSMKRSMRGSAPPERPLSPAMSSRFSIRSLSPTGSFARKPFNSGMTTSSSQNHMRNSLRASVGPAPSLRAPKPEKTSLFGRSSSAKPASKPARQRTSRFADSSDEEDVRPAFSSRFVDSDDSDDDRPAPRSGGFGAGTMRASAPARPLSKRTAVDDGDSSDLADSDNEKNTPAAALKLDQNRQSAPAPGPLATGSLRRSGSGRETMASPSGPTRPQNARRGSLMSILRRKKDPSSQVRKAEVESAARRDTPLERSKSDLQAMRLEGGPSTPKLQKRQPQWPLVSDSPPKIMGGENGRPFTADAGDGVVGPNSIQRPEAARRFTATGAAPIDLQLGGVVAGGKKKKKFGKLRRIFRLDD